MVGRWEDGAADAVWHALSSGGDLGELGIGRTEAGHWDLRGIAAPRVTERPTGTIGSLQTTEITGQLTLTGVTLEGMDFGGASWPSLRLFDTRFVGCIFDSADMKDLRMWRSDLVDCTFRGTRLKPCQLGAWSDEERRGNTVSGCLFENTDLSELNSSAGNFTDCRFLGVKMNDIQFMATNWTRCVFTGQYTDVRWDGRPMLVDKYPGITLNRMDGCDFVGAKLDGCTFFGLDTSGLKLPSDSMIAVVNDFESVMGRAATYIGALQSDVQKKFGAVGKMFERKAHQMQVPAGGQNLFDLKIYAGRAEWIEMARAALVAGGWDGRTAGQN
ncbi:MAG: pentapeptide repeat-containing protein [Nakamurella sp.]